jgi:hypothetical protein
MLEDRRRDLAIKVPVIRATAAHPSVGNRPPCALPRHRRGIVVGRSCLPLCVLALLHPFSRLESRLGDFTARLVSSPNCPSSSETWAPRSSLRMTS